MFLGHFVDEEKEGFIELAKLMIAADGVFAPEEIAMFESILHELNIKGDVEIVNATLESACAHISRPEARVFALLELATIAFIDHDYGESEKALLASICEEWNMATDLLPLVEGWAQRRITLTTDVGKILSVFVPKPKPIEI